MCGWIILKGSILARIVMSCSMRRGLEYYCGEPESFSMNFIHYPIISRHGILLIRHEIQMECHSTLTVISFRLRLRDLHQPADGYRGHQVDAPQPHYGGLQFPPRGQVCRQSEGQGAQEDPGPSDQSLGPGARSRPCPQLWLHTATLNCPALPRPRQWLCRR